MAGARKQKSCLNLAQDTHVYTSRACSGCGSYLQVKQFRILHSGLCALCVVFVIHFHFDFIFFFGWRQLSEK